MPKLRGQSWKAGGAASGPDEKLDHQAVLEARLRVLEYALDHSVSEILQRVIDEAERLTGSRVGFFHLVDSDQATIRFQAWSTRTRSASGPSGNAGAGGSAGAAGAWAECLRTRRPIIRNDPRAGSCQMCLPDSRVRVRRCLQVPVLRGEAAVAVLGVANKATDYTERDLEAVAGLADLTWDIASRKIAEDAVKKSEAFSRAILDSMSAHIAVLDREGNILAVNKAWRQFAAENGGGECCSQNYFEACARATDHGDPGPELAMKGIKAVMDGERPRFEMEYPCPTPKEDLWFRMTVYPLAHREGGVVVAHEDITQRHRAEARLAEALERYRSLFELFPAGIVIAGSDGRIREANAIAEELLGVSKEEMRRRTLDDPRWEVLRPDGSPMPPCEFSGLRALREGRLVRDVDMGVKLPNGETRWLTVSASPFPGGEEAVAIAFVDVSEKRKAEAEIRASSNRFSTIFHKNPVAIALSDLKTNQLLDVNAAWLELLGYERREVVGRTATELGVWADPAERGRLLRQVRKHGAVRNFEIKARRKDGEPIEVVLFAEVIEVNNQKCLLSMGLDNTDRKRAESILKASQARLEQMVRERTAELESSYRELESLSYSISHNLRGPLRALDGFSRILLAEHHASLNEDGKDCLKRICAASERMGVLVDAMVQLSRLNRAEIKPKEVDLASLFRSRIRRLSDLEPDRRFVLRVQEGVKARGDPSMLASLIDNLADNAWKFTSRERVARLSFTCKQKGGRTIYCVKDNGIGFSMDYSKNIFEPFHRLCGQDEFGGLGIGLAIAMRVVKRHGGDIWAQSEPGKGARFYFTVESDRQGGA